MMFLLITKLLIFVRVSKAILQYNDQPQLIWPEKYRFDLTKIYLTSGLIEDVQYWRTNRYSRADYNKGAVKVFTVLNKTSDFPYGAKYEIHPETTEEYTNKLVCSTTPGTNINPMELDNKLPDTSKFTFEDNITLDGDVGIFINEESDFEMSMKATLWAKYDYGSGTWSPVRLTILSSNNWIGNFGTHEIWDFTNFDTNFSEDVFKLDQYNCSSSNKTVTLDDELVTKHLMFIDPEDDGHVDHVFNAFKLKYNKQYNNKKDEVKTRRIFQQNMRLIQSHNRNGSSYKMSINKFADRTMQDMNKMMGLIRPETRIPGNIPFPYTRAEVMNISSFLPSELDLRMLGLVSPVKDQKDCGCCWSFGSTSAAEGALARSNGGRLLRLSNQALIDCAWGFNASGCDGGDDTSAYRWMIEYGLPTEEEYGPYNNRDGFCRIHNMTTKYPIRGFTNVTPFNVQALKVALANHGPLSVSIDATYLLKSYSEGIFYDIKCTTTNLNHEVTLVGYGNKDGEEYWIVKNSWGKDWGLDGYFHISTRDNNCGITAEPTYVVF